MNSVLLRDLLFNCSVRSGSTLDYARGVVMGAVATFMAMGYEFKIAFRTVLAHMPDDAMDVLPPGWK